MSFRLWGSAENLLINTLLRVGPFGGSKQLLSVAAEYGHHASTLAYAKANSHFVFTLQSGNGNEGL